MKSVHEKTKQVVLESWGVTQRGKQRQDNQDAFLNWPEFRLWAVADGMGDLAAGGEASKMLMDCLMLAKSSLSLDDHVRQTRDLLAQANAELIKVNQESLASAATLVCLLFHEGDAACLWSGDSRCYLFRGGVLYQCTRDHTLRQHKIDLGELTVPEAKRMVSGHVVTNAIGVTQELNLEEVRLKIMAEDRFLLCSDGLSNLLSPEALASGLLGTSAKDCVDELMRFIEHKEQPDNITALVVSLGSLR